MRKRWAWSLSGATVLAGAIAIIWNSGPSLPTLRFPDGTSSRILKVSVGTEHRFSWEPVWKRSLRTVLPESFQKRLGPARKYTFSTPYDSLVLYLEPIPGRTDPLQRMRVEALFPDGVADGAALANRWMPPAMLPVVLNSYPREQKEILLRFSNTASQIEIKVPNPRVVTRASWSPRALPQTNHISGTQVVLKKLLPAKGARHELVLDAYSTIGAPVSWIQWRTTLFDPLGNWSADGSTRRPPFPGGRNERVFKLLIEGAEYISAGFFPMPTNQQHHIIGLKPRMTNWGVRFVALFGPGTYEVSKAFEVKPRNSVLPTTNILKRAWSSWIVECVQPVSFCISERAVSDVRLRERFPDNKGRIFNGAPTTSLSKGGLTAQLFTPRLRTPSGSAAANARTNILEAEVVVRWPAVEFFVQRPE